MIHNKRDQATLELLKQYPSYNFYKAARIALGKNTYAYNHGSIDRRWGTWNKCKEYFGLVVKKSNNNKNGNRLNEEGNRHSKEELLDWVKKYPQRDVFQQESQKNIHMPSTNTVNNTFGGWANARHEAKVGFKGAPLEPNAATLVYLVHFTDDNVFKAGITQKSIKHRGSGWPEYTVVETFNASTLYEAKNIERKTLDFYSYWQYYYSPLRANGATECFLSNTLPQIQK